MFLISCHADTGFVRHRLVCRPGGILYGQLDNFAGVAAVMEAYLSGRLTARAVGIELTYGEETDFAGARAVARRIGPRDTVAVVDVTGAPTRADLTVEKCPPGPLRRRVARALRGLRVEYYEGCPDPIASSDETDIYRKRTPRTFFLGIPVTGGDYNELPVACRRRSIAAAAEALVRLADAFGRRTRRPGSPSCVRRRRGPS